jgi:hypothetical protein
MRRADSKGEFADTNDRDGRSKIDMVVTANVVMNVVGVVRRYALRIPLQTINMVLFFLSPSTSRLFYLILTGDWLPASYHRSFQHWLPR